MHTSQGTKREKIRDSEFGLFALDDNKYTTFLTLNGFFGVI